MTPGGGAGPRAADDAGGGAGPRAADGAGGGAGAPSPGTVEGTVLGVGVDLVHVPSFVDQLALPGTRFAGVFTPGERRDAAERAAQVGRGQHGGGEGRHLAARWAAKEAFVKAWSASIFGEPPVMGDEVLGLVEVVCDAWGRPRLRLHGEVAEHLPGVEAHVSLSHDGDHALAYVVLAEGARR
ncbi:holo-ACP synthase [Aeromicrobium sp. Leaf272]|uniref:holo-ACP synthase AcpS n=1 Tax=Aeromicrobium sp. Leaf272 TaxID=1736317 RepID=UPI000AD93F09|nr:holo-ACP synthase [Aeromicrobium sp. Leaf272]